MSDRQPGSTTPSSTNSSVELPKDSASAAAPTGQPSATPFRGRRGRKPRSADPMAGRAPAHILAERKPEEVGPKIEMGASYFDPQTRTPGIGQDGYILNHRLYITPEPGMDYRWCTNDARRTARNRTRGWQSVTVNHAPVVAGNMTLCQRPASIGEARRKELIDAALRRSSKARAEAVAATNPNLTGTERREIIGRSDF